MRTLVIGDIHGSLTALKALVESVGFAQDDLIITVGDYVDRGPQSKQVIDYLLELRTSHRLVTLKGNHEVMMENARGSEQELQFWLLNGGEATMKSFQQSDPARIGHTIAQSYWDFIGSCEPYYETDTHIIAHAGLDPDTDLKDQQERDLYWRRINDTQAHKSGKILICGHTPQKNGTPIVLDHAVGIDTHAFGKDGWLTCLHAETGKYWQANQKGETRSNTLQPA